MSRLLEHGLSVGYVTDEKKLTVTVTKQMAKKMRQDGWDVHHVKEIGYFVIIGLVEGENGSNEQAGQDR